MKLFKVSRPTIYTWINQGTLRAMKIGRDYYVSEDEVNRYYNEKYKRDS
jgi:excisionase family DNA binding protein